MAKVLVTMPDKFLNRVDSLASSENRSRSDLIREALTAYMRKISKSQEKVSAKNAEILENLIG